MERTSTSVTSSVSATSSGKGTPAMADAMTSAHLGDVKSVGPMIVAHTDTMSMTQGLMVIGKDVGGKDAVLKISAEGPSDISQKNGIMNADMSASVSMESILINALQVANNPLWAIEELEAAGRKGVSSELSIEAVGDTAGTVVTAQPGPSDMAALQGILANMEPAAGESGGAGRAGGAGFGSAIDPAILMGLDRLGGIAAITGLGEGLLNSGRLTSGNLVFRTAVSVSNSAESADDTQVFDGSNGVAGIGNILDNDVSTSGSLVLKSITLNGVVHDVPEMGIVTIVGTMGTLEIDARGDYSYTPLDAALVGSDIGGVDLFEYTAEDAAGIVTTATLAVTVNDQIPVAVDDVIAADPMNLTRTGSLLSGDQSGNGALRLSTVNGQSVGSEGITIDRPDLGYKIVIAADGSYVMTADNLKTGVDTLTYSTVDADGDVSNTATAAISFADTAPTLTSKIVASTNMNLVTTGSILTGSDLVGDGSVRVGSVSGQIMPAGGSLVLDTADYTLTIHANGAYRLEGKDGRTATNIQIPITTVDSDGDISNTAVITVSVRDRVPEVLEESTTVRGGLNVATQAITGTINGVLVPDMAGDGAHQYELISSGQGRFGTITLAADGTYRYELNSTKDVLTNTPDLFEKISYRVTDEDGDTAVSDLYIIIGTDGSWTLANLHPQGVDETVTLQGALNIATQQIVGSISGNVLSNGDQLGNNPAKVTLLNGNGQGLFGSITINTDGTYTYTLDSRATKTSLQGPLVSETFIYQITDADGDMSTAAITLQIRPDGSWSQNNLVPVASGEIVAIDGGLDLATQRVTGSIAGTVLDSNDNLGDGLARVELVGSAVGSHGRLTLNADGTYSYALNDAKLNLQGTPTDSFTYRIIDRDGDVSNTVTLTVRIGSDGTWSQSNATPTAVGEITSVAGTLDAATQIVTGITTGSVLSNGDSVGDGLLRVELLNSGRGAHGTLTLNTDGTYSYALNDSKLNLQGTPTDSFTYRIIDRDGDVSNTVTLTINIGSDGTWSTSNKLVSALSENETLVGTLSGSNVVGTLSGKNVTSNDNLGDAPAKVTLVGSATGKFGSIVLNSDGTYTYTLNADKNAMRGDLTETFTYRVTDKDGDTSTATLSISITSDGTWVADNTAPVAVDGSGGISSGEVAIDGNIISSLVSSGNGTKTITSISINGGAAIAIGVSDSVHAGTHGTLIIRADGTYTYVGKDHAKGTDLITYTVRDADGDTDSATLSLSARDLLPTAGAVSATELGDGNNPVTISGDLMSGSSGGDGTLRIASIAGRAVPAGGSITLTGSDIGVSGVQSIVVNSNGSYTLIAAKGVSINGGAVSFVVTDQDGDTSSSNLVINVGNVDGAATLPGLSVDAININEDGQAQLVIRAANNDTDSERLTVTAKIPSGWSVIDAAGGSVSGNTWTRTLGVGEGLNGGPTLQPPANWNGSTSIPVSVTSTETNNGATVSTSSTASVTVNAVNDAPTIDNAGTTATGSVQENAAAGTSIVKIDGSDVDGGASWSLSGPGSEKFEILSDGTIRNIVPLDADAATGGTSVYNLAATLSDGQSSVSRNVQINVGNINDNTPTLGISGTGVVAENLSANTEVTGISLSKGDADGNATTYEIVSGNTGNAFRIDANTGQIYTNIPLDKETISTYVLQIRVRDDGGNVSNTSDVTIHIANVNEAPSIDSLSAWPTVTENQGAVNVVQMTGSDPDSAWGDTIHWSIVSGNTSLFRINSNTGWISTTGQLNYEDAHGYDLVIRATDSSGLTYDRSISVNVGNVNEQAAITGGTSGSVNENDTSTVVMRVTANDPDGDTIAWSLVGNDANQFRIDASTGEIRVAPWTGGLNFESQPNGGFDIYAVATSNGQFTQTGRLSISVNDVNEAPVLQGYNNTINRNEDTSTQSNSSMITSLGAVDWEGNLAGWQITGGTGFGKFSISAVGIVTANQLFDYESMGTDKSYILEIQAVDAGGLKSNTAYITVNIANVNEVGSISGPSSATVNENLSAGTVVARMSLSGDPEGDTPTWSIIAGTTGSAGAFNIDSSGNITTNKKFDYETDIKSYTLTVQADDGHGGRVTKDVTVNIGDVNEAPVVINTSWHPTWMTISALNHDNQVTSLFTGGYFAASGGRKDQEIDFIHDTSTVSVWQPSNGESGGWEWVDYTTYLQTGRSEKLIFDFHGNTVTSATVELANFNPNDNTGGAEGGYWKAYLNNVLVGESDFWANGQNLTIPTIAGGFDKLVFSAIGMPTGSWDSSDYGVSSITLYGADSLGEAPPVTNPGGGGGGGGRSPKTPIALNPVVLDLNHDGHINLVSIDYGVKFDMTNDGVKDYTGWVAAEDGQLAVDLNHNGIIDNQNELFGSPVGSALEVNGFTELASYDENGDGKVSAMDSVWSKLIVWQDLNQDGISQADEMKSVVEYEIASISTTATRVDENVAGNPIYWDGDITMNDGSSMNIVDAYYQVVDGATTSNTADTSAIAADTSSIDAAIATTLTEQLSASETTDLDAAIHEFLTATEGSGNSAITNTDAALVGDQVVVSPLMPIVLTPDENQVQ